MPPLWTPSPDRVAATQVHALCRRLALPDTDALHAWSVADPGRAWRTVWDELGVRGDPGDVALAPGDGTVAGGRFFPNGRLSFAEHLLAGSGPGPAVIAHREEGPAEVLSWEELRAEVAAMAAALRGAGVGPGDRVAAWLPNTPPAVVTMLATTAIGAVFSSTSPDFGTAGVLDRFGQIEPVVLVAADGYRYGGQRFDTLGRLRDIAAGLPTLRQVVVAGELHPQPDLAAIGGAVGWEGFVGAHRGAPLPLERFPFDHPGFVLYSSGTTGPPKCILHRAGGILLKHLTEHRLHCDVRAGDCVLYFTTTGWMMWNWLTSALASRATIVLYDGNPFHPSPTRLFDLVDEHGVTLLGVSAKYLDSLRKAGEAPARTRRLDTLRTLCSTGSPLSPEGFAYVYDAVRADVHLASISGGTDLCGCFVAGDPTRPVWAGELQVPAYAMAVDVVDEGGRPVRGQRGELVCTAPFPSVPLGFLGDPDGRRFRAAYFDRFPGAWAHGDFASWTEHGGMVIHGRSDATLNAGGVRIGTAEIYRQVEQLREVAEAIAVGQEWDGDTRIVLFVRLADGAELDAAVEDRIRTTLRERCSPRHVPARILAVPDIPRTRSGKITELAVADVVNGRPVRNTEALANPEALDAYRDRPELST